jgi:hypothetical protein
MPSLKVGIEPVQEGSGDPSPENIRPISGWTEANVNVSPTTSAEDGTTYTIEFRDGDNPLTVYGGTLDVTSGELVVDRASVDLGSLTWTTALSGRHNTVPPNAKGANNNVIGNILCARYISVSGNTIANVDKAICHINGVSIQVNDSALNGADATDFKSAMNGVKLVYELATPITYHLTPAQIRTLVGNNNIWADTGDIIEGKYFKSLT